MSERTWRNVAEREKVDFKRAEEWQVISHVNSGEWDGSRKERAGGVGSREIVMIVKTSDDSLCPLCGDCSLINLAAEILHPWVKMRIALPSPPLPPPRHFQMLVRWNEQIPLKYDTKEAWSTLGPHQKKSPPPCYPHTFPLFPSFCLLPHQNPSSLYSSHHLLRIFFFFYPQVLSVGPKNISPSLSSNLPSDDFLSHAGRDHWHVAH